MKRLTLILILILLSKPPGFGQNNITHNVQLLSSQISQIKNSETFLQFLIDHAATYEDFDSLYSIIEGKSCPKNYTYNIVNGDSANLVSINKLYLYIIARNFFRPPYDMNQQKIRSMNGLIEMFTGEIKDPFTNLYIAKQKISSQIKNNIKINIDSLEITTGVVHKGNMNNTIIKSNLRSWARTVDFRNKESSKFGFDNNLANKNGLLVYKIGQNCEWENRYWNQIKLQDENFLKNDLGGSVTAENISRYISAQVFNDIVFFEVNGKMIWIDINP